MSKPATERRRGPDLLVRLLTIANAAVGVLLIVAFCLTAMAKPELETFFDRFYNVNLYRRPGWDLQLLRYIAALFVVCAMTSIAGLSINLRRRRRRGDFLRVTLVIGLVISLLGFGLCLRHLLIYG